MYERKPGDEKRDRITVWGGAMLVIAFIFGASLINLPIFVGAAVLTYGLTGLYVATRILHVRSHLGPLNKRDLKMARTWALLWPQMYPLVVHDDFPIMNGPEAELVKSPRGMTSCIEQAAAASRWRLGDASGHMRRPNEFYKA